MSNRLAVRKEVAPLIKRSCRHTGLPDLSPEEIQSALGARSSSFPVVRFYEQVDSTNRVAHDLAERGAREGTVIIADCQTAGRGRLGRSWFSPPGKNLHLSLILKPPLSPRDAPILTLMAAVACARALRAHASLSVSIKWPNDLIVGERKVGGVLTELRTHMDRIRHVIIGFGLNINMDEADLSDGLRPTATSIKIEAGISWSRTKIAAALLGEVDRWYRILLSAGPEPVVKEWQALSSTIGRSVRVAAGVTSFEGRATGIDNEGQLIVRLADGTCRKVAEGDVMLLRIVQS